MHPDLSPAYCPVCASVNIKFWNEAKDFEYFSTTDLYRYFQCTDCYSIFISPIPFAQLNKIYPPNYYSFVNQKKNIVSGVKEWMDKNFFKKILKQIRGVHLNVLDVGGGNGWLLDQLKKTDARIGFTQVIDIDEKAADNAIQNGHSYFKGIIEEFQTEKKFNLILLLNLIEHVADPKAVIIKCQDLLADGGSILVKTPNTKSWDARLFKNSYWGGLHAPRHWIIFSEKSFRLMISSTSLDIQKLSYTQGAPFWAFSIIAALHRKKMITVSAKKPIIFHWLFAPLAAFFAAFDFLRRPFAKTSQMFIILGRDKKD